MKMFFNLLIIIAISLVLSCGDNLPKNKVIYIKPHFENKNLNIDLVKIRYEKLFKLAYEDYKIKCTVIDSMLKIELPTNFTNIDNLINMLTTQGKLQFYRTLQFDNSHKTNISGILDNLKIGYFMDSLNSSTLVYISETDTNGIYNKIYDYVSKNMNKDSVLLMWGINFKYDKTKFYPLYIVKQNSISYSKLNNNNILKVNQIKNENTIQVEFDKDGLNILKQIMKESFENHIVIAMDAKVLCNSKQKIEYSNKSNKVLFYGFEKFNERMDMYNFLRTSKIPYTISIEKIK